MKPNLPCTLAPGEIDMLKNLIAWLRSLRYLQLTILFLLFFLIMPAMTGHPILEIFFQVLLLNVSLVSLSTGGRQPKLRWLLVAPWLAGIAFYLKYRLIMGEGPPFTDLMVSWSCYLVLMVGCIVISLAYVFQNRQITLDAIFAAVAAFFLLALLFADLYSLLYFLEPGSFNFTVRISPNQPHILLTDLSYFSLITIVGVGYGDILPLLPFPRMLAAVEAVIGHFYVAVLVAWLVGMFISQALMSCPEPTAPERLDPPDA
jgi:voltage-gated potassium channel